jgi:hypothetical protein
MSAISSLAITDGKATPLTHTLYPIQTVPNSIWREQDSANPLVGQGNLQVSVVQDKTGSGVNKVRMTLSIPAVETVGSAGSSAGYVAAPKVAYITKADLTFFLPTRSTLAQRKDLQFLLISLLNQTLISDSIQNVVAPY